MTMSYADNRTTQLWRSFMPVRRRVKHVTGTELYSIQVFDKGFFQDFRPDATFTKWAGVAVASFGEVPEGMDTLTIPGGLYAVFLNRGPASEGAKVFSYIFSEWLPASGYQLDDRPHFELLGEKYSNTDPSSEEEIWIPVKSK